MIDTGLDSFNFYFLAAVFQGALLSGFILFRKPIQQANAFLGAIIFLFSLTLLHLVLEQSIHAFNARYPIPMNLGLAYGPLAYLHVVSIIRPGRRFVIADLLHFVPTFIIDILLFSGFFWYAGNHLEWAYHHLETIQTASMVLSLANVLQLALYTIAIHRSTTYVSGALKDYSKISSWFRFVVVSLIILVSFASLAAVAALLYIDRLDEISSLIYNPLGMIMGLYIYGLGYVYLLRYAKPVADYTSRLQRFTLSETELATRKEQLVKLMETAQLYKDPELSVSTLASHIGWPVNELSFVINEAFRTNFSDWVNRLRVEAYLKLLGEPANSRFSLVGLSQEVGFTSKASFYRAFRRETGQTPTDYLREKGLK